MRFCWKAICCWLLLSLVVPHRGHAEEPSQTKTEKGETAKRAEARAQALFHEGMAHKHAGEYDQAVRAFSEAYALSPQANYLYLLGETHMEAGHAKEAIAAYRRYLEASPDAPDRQSVLDQLDALAPQEQVPPETKGKAPPRPTPPAPIQAGPGTTTPAAALPAPVDLAAFAHPQEEPRVPLYRRPWLWITVGAVVVVGVAIGVGVALRPAEQTFTAAPGSLP
jgi:tetratricopeptide (TPR) repeat protein